MYLNYDDVNYYFEEIYINITGDFFTFVSRLFNTLIQFLIHILQIRNMVKNVMNKLERKSQSKKIFSIILHSTIISYYLIAQFIFKQKKKKIQRKNNNTPIHIFYKPKL